jgi:Mrp family chromosome partitioning ATPase/capsular polysaccharide biosynthesis protein
MNNPRQETTIADYLRVIRQRRLFIAVVAVICAGAALGLSLLQKPSYDATASLAINDPNQDLSLLGTAFVSNQTPLQLASIHAPTVTREEVVARVKAALHSPLSLAALKKSVTVGIDPNSFLVTIDAGSRRAADAAATANAFAQADTSLSTAEARRGFAAAAKQLQKKFRNLPPTQDSIDQLSRLRSLSTVAAPVTIAQSASVPGSPTSPKPVRNTAAALVFGLLLGIALAYGREALDRRLRRSADVEQLFDHPVVGHIRAEALGHAGSSTGAGSNGSGPLADLDAESFRILRHNVRYLAAGDGVRTLLVSSAMAQEGKSTVAACLAMASAEAGKRTLLIECDLRRPVLAKRFGLRERPGLTDYLTGHATPQEIMQVVASPPSSSNGSGNVQSGSGLPDQAPLVCITSGAPPPRPADLLASERFQQFLAEVGDVYESVIIDSAPLLAVADTLEIVPHVSGMLLCVRLRQTTREQARATRMALERLPGPPIGVVLTDVKGTDEAYYGYYSATPAAVANA